MLCCRLAYQLAPVIFPDLLLSAGRGVRGVLVCVVFERRRRRARRGARCVGRGMPQKDVCYPRCLAVDQAHLLCDLAKRCDELSTEALEW